MKSSKRYVNWREDLREVVDIPSSESKDQDRSEKEITDKKVKNKIVINPVMGEAIEALGGTILEFVELGEQEEDQDKEKDKLRQSQIRHQQQMMAKQQMLDRQRLQMQKQGKIPMGHAEEVEYVDEKMDLAKADMGDVIKDFYKSDAPQFKGKSKKKRQQMAIAAKLTAERGGRKLGEAHDKPAERLKTDRNMFTISSDEREAARNRLLAKSKARREAKKIDESTRVERERGQDPSKSSRAAAAITSLARAKTPFLKQKHKEDFPGSRQPKKVPGEKETQAQAENRRRGQQASRAAKYGLTSKEKKETQAREKYYSSRD